MPKKKTAQKKKRTTSRSKTKAKPTKRKVGAKRAVAKRPKKELGPKPKLTKPIRRESLAIKEGITQQRIIEEKLQRFVSWTAMSLLIFTNFVAAILLIPFLLFFEGIAQYTVITLFGIGFGLIFNLMIHSIEHLGDRHHIIAGVLVPCFALLDVAILFGILEKAKKVLDLDVTYNYTFMVVLFILAFLIPYLIDVARQKHKF